MVSAGPVLILLPQDGNGYIDEHELDALLKDLCEKNKQVIVPEPLTAEADFADPSSSNHTYIFRNLILNIYGGAVDFNSYPALALGSIDFYA